MSEGEALPKVAKSQIFKLWEKGTPTQNAPLTFLPDRDFPEGTKRADYKVPQFNLGTLIQDALEQMKKSGMDGPQAITEVTAPIAALFNDRNSLIERGKAAVLDWLESGVIRAFAFEKPRKVQDDPVELEPSTLIKNPYFRWDLGTANHQGLEFVEIRMLPEATVAALIAKWRDEAGTGARMLTDPTTKPVGRPSLRPLVIDAFRTLHAQGKIDYSKRLTSHYPLIRQWLAAHYPSVEANDQKPSDDTIRNAVGPLFNAEKAKT
jgi:hypothetical protein